jgi:hypothetical protein
MKAIVFEDSQAYQWNGRAWRKVPLTLALKRVNAGEAYWFASRERAAALCYIPMGLAPLPAQRRKCNHEYVSIGWAGYPTQVAAGWRYRCQKCGGYRR